MVGTIAIAIAKSNHLINRTIWNLTFKKSRFQMVGFQILTVLNTQQMDKIWVENQAIPVFWSPLYFNLKIIIFYSRCSETIGAKHWTNFCRPTISRNSRAVFARPRARDLACWASTNRPSPSRTSSAPSLTRLSPWGGSNLFRQVSGPENGWPLLDLDPADWLLLIRYE